MVRNENVTSIRIVSVDHYMHKPEALFDTCYSEFRGSDVKQVPVIRLFGSTSDGTHSCVHIHGVFPYLYVPYDGNTADTLAVDRLVYQIAASLDKAINVSLGNANSTNTHVFRIVLVKGIPIYGYHRKEHQFLKIYLYNPYFIRKATNLLMNGVILSRVFQTFETHVPYILQFFIDYNLYGMSFLRVPNSAIRERSGDGHAPQRMSTSEYEIDILAADILNRSMMEEEKRSEYANPGIASIWNDEKTRRQLLAMDQPEALSFSQNGNMEVVTESDRFYRSLLASKIANKQSHRRPVEEDSKRVKPPVSFYPSEAADDDHLLDASCIQDHKNFTQSVSFNQSNTTYNFDTNEIEEEQLVSMSQTLNATFAEEDHDLLDIMKELEENECNGVEGDSLLAPLTQQSQGRIASTGGSGVSLSQSSNKRLNATLTGDLEAASLMNIDNVQDDVQAPQDDSMLDSDDEFLLDYTMKRDVIGKNNFNEEGSAMLNDSDDDLLNLSNIPQLDGAHEEIAATAPKRTRPNGSIVNANINGIQTNGHEPFQKRIKFSRQPKNFNGCEPMKRVLVNGSLNGDLEVNVKKKVKLEQTVAQGMLNNEFFAMEDVPKMKELKIRLSKVDLSAYRLPAPESPVKVKKRDQSPYDAFRLAREYDLANNWDPQEGPTRKRGRRGRPKKVKPASPRKTTTRVAVAPKPEPEPEPEIDVVLSQKFQNIIKLSPKVLLTPLSKQQMTDLKEERDTPETNPVSKTDDQVIVISSDSEPVFVTDEESRSSANQTVMELPDISLEVSQNVSCSPTSAQLPPVKVQSSDGDGEEEDVEDLNIQSFYEKTLVFDDFDEMASGSDDSIENFRFHTPTENDKRVTVTLQGNPPSFGDALKALQEFVIPQVINQEPFYSNPDDLTGKKEVGQVVLNIGSHRLNDLEEFKSVVAGLGSINQMRYEKLSCIYGEDLNQILGGPSSVPDSGRLKELVASERTVIIQPLGKPPSRHEAKVWLKAMDSIKSKESAPVEEDSPIKIKKMQAIMVGDSDKEPKDPPKTKIDHESMFNLSSLITDDHRHDSSARKSLISKIFSMNSRSSPAENAAVEVGSPVVFTPSGTDQLELLSYSARRKRRKIPKARLSLRTAFKRLRGATVDIETTVREDGDEEEITPGQDSNAHLNIEEGIDVVNSSQILSASQKSTSDSATSDQTTLPPSAEIASMKRHLLAESPLLSQSMGNSGNISGTTPNNTYGFKVNFENLQKAKATCEVS